MSVSPQYETYEYTACGPCLRAQSIVECRLDGRADEKLLAASPRVVCGVAEVLPGEVRYGGKLFFSAVTAAPDGAVTGVERGAEFSHRAACEDAAPAQKAEVRLRVEKVETRTEGRALVLSAIVTAEIDLYAPAQLRCLAGGEGVVCDRAPARIARIALCSGTFAQEEEFETDYVGDILLHSEQVCLRRVVAGPGSLDVSGEVNLAVLAKKEGERETVAYERLIPFRAEIPCAEAEAGMPCDARAEVLSANLTAACDEEKGRCSILARLELRVFGRVYRVEEVQLPRDAFCPGFESTPAFAAVRAEQPLCAFTAAERVSGAAASDGPVAETLQSAALCSVEVAATVADGEVLCEGVLNAVVFGKDGDGAPASARVSLPFSFPVRSDRARAGDRAEVSALCCGVSVRRRAEPEAEGSLKLFVTLYTAEEGRCVADLAVGSPADEAAGAVTVFFPAAGDTLWEVAKKLGRAPEEVAPGLSFPLTGSERIVLWRRRDPG